MNTTTLYETTEIDALTPVEKRLLEAYHADGLKHVTVEDIRRVIEVRAKENTARKKRKENNRRLAYGIIGRLVQSGVLDIDDFACEFNPVWADNFANAYFEILHALKDTF